MSKAFMESLGSPIMGGDLENGCSFCRRGQRQIGRLHCGHRICADCYSLHYPKMEKCFICVLSTASIQWQDIELQPSPVISNSKLRFCRHFGRGCSFVGDADDIGAHEKTCSSVEDEAISVATTSPLSDPMGWSLLRDDGSNDQDDEITPETKFECADKYVYEESVPLTPADQSEGEERDDVMTRSGQSAALILRDSSEARDVQVFNAELVELREEVAQLREGRSASAQPAPCGVFSSWWSILFVCIVAYMALIGGHKPSLGTTTPPSVNHSIILSGNFSENTIAAKGMRRSQQLTALEREGYSIRVSVTYVHKWVRHNVGVVYVRLGVHFINDPLVEPVWPLQRTVRLELLHPLDGALTKKYHFFPDDRSDEMYKIWRDPHTIDYFVYDPTITSDSLWRDAFVANNTLRLNVTLLNS